jgi:predicted DNA-binding protein (MmcQ/YjbR family)
VGGKMFACIGAVMPGVSVKTDGIEIAEMLIDAGVGVKAPYFHRSWINLPWSTSEEELRHRLAASYRLVRSRLPKKVHSQLAPFD